MDPRVEGRQSESLTPNETHDVESLRLTFSKRIGSLLYPFIDQLLILLIISPSNVMVWRGTWLTFDAYLLPEKIYSSAWVSVSIGISFTVLMFVLVEWKTEAWKLSEKTTAWKLVMYPMCVASTNAWRGMWMLFNYYLPINYVSLLSCHFGSSVLLSMTKTMANSMILPSVFVSDSTVTPFKIDTALGMSTAKVSAFYKMFDCGFSMSVITVSTVNFWWSSWTAMNTYLYPSSPALSNMLSVIVGYVTIIFCKLVKGFLKSAAEKSSKPVVFGIQVIFSYVMGISTISVWRGVWELANFLVFPDHAVVFAITSHACAILILYITSSVINASACPCMTGSHCLETLNVFQTTTGTVVCRPSLNDAKANLASKQELDEASSLL